MTEKGPDRQLTVRAFSLDCGGLPAPASALFNAFAAALLLLIILLFIPLTFGPERLKVAFLIFTITFCYY